MKMQRVISGQSWGTRVSCGLLAAALAIAVMGVTDAGAVRDYIIMGGQGQYGLIWGGNGFGTDYDDGPGLGIGVRFTLGHKRMIGASFESNHYYAANTPPAYSDDLPDRLEFTVTTLTGYQRISFSASGFTYVSLGIGYAQPTEFRTGDRTKVHFDRFLLVAGFGREMLITKRLALDIGAKLYSMHSSDGNNQAVEASLGLYLYIPR
jgi:hypothetical protein